MAVRKWPSESRKSDSATKTTGLGFGVLGPLLMTADGASVPLGAPKQRAVLAMLLINRNRPVSVDALIDAVWEEDPVPAARTSIQSYVSTLRRLLRGAAGDPYGVLASAPPITPVSPPPTATSAASAPRRRRGFVPPARVSSRRPAATCQPPWRNGGDRCWTICATSPSSAHLPPGCSKTEWWSTPPAPKRRSPADAPTA